IFVHQNVGDVIRAGTPRLRVGLATGTLVSSLRMLTPRQAADNAVFPFGDYLYDPARRLVCVAIPKNACTDLKHWFMSLVEPAKLAEPGFRLHAHVRATHTLAGKPRAEAERIVRESFA